MASNLITGVVTPRNASKEQCSGSKRGRRRRKNCRQWKSVCYCFNVVLLLQYLSAMFVHGFAGPSYPPDLSRRRSGISSSKTTSSSTIPCTTSMKECPIRAQRKVRRSSTSLFKATPTGGGDQGEEDERMVQQATKKKVRLQVFQTLSNPVVEVAAGQFKAIYLTKPLVVLDIVVVLVPLLLGSAMLPLLDYLSGVTNYTSSNEQAAVLTFLAGLQNSTGLQNLLLLRVLRLRRILTDNITFGRFAVVLGLKPQDIRPYQLQLARVLLSILTLLSVSSGLIYTAEHQVNPAIPDYFSALYFGLTTLTTVGLGDITPITPQGRLVVCGSILFGVAIIPVQTAKLVDIFVESQKDQQLRRKKPKPKRKTVTTSTSVVSMLSATNGLGPSGVAIEVPVEDRAPPEEGGRICGNCMASPHRADAIFCWSCGSPLPLVVTANRRRIDEDDDGTSLR